MNNKMISTTNLSISFGNKKVLNDITFDVKKNEIFGFLGPSGAGKTTTIKILTRQLTPKTGTCEVNTSIDEIGVLSDNSGAYERLTVYRNLCFFAELSKCDKENVDKVLKQVKLWEDKDKKVQNLSKGMKQRLLLACAIIHNPKLLFLDEPTAALDPATVNEIHELLFSLKEKGTTIFLTTHNMEEADKLCDRVAFLDRGKIVDLGTPKDLKVKYGNDSIDIIYENDTVETVKKNNQSIIKALTKSKQKIKSIHSQEPNLSEIFLTLTGRELK